MAKNIAASAGADYFGVGRDDRKASIIERGVNWLAALRVTRHENEIERYINEHGGILTDSLEREISQKFANAEPGRY